MRLFIAGLLAFFGTIGYAGEKGSIGFSGKVAVDGFFNPEIASFEVDEVHAGSPAEEAGLKSGDKVVAIEDCKIPGCDTDDAKALMERAPGDELRLTIETKDGEGKEVVIIVGAPKKDS